jgi:signal transduction histidine kinase
MASEEFAHLQQRLEPVTDPVGFLVSLFSYAPVAFAIWKTDGHCLLTNKAFRDLFGSEPPPDYNVLHDEIAAQTGVLALIRRAFAGETVQLPTFWYDPRDLQQVNVSAGNRVAISMTVFPVFNREGEIDFVAASYKDETEVTLAQENLKAEGEQLRELVHEMQREAVQRRQVEDALRQREESARAFQEKLKALHEVSIELAQAGTLDDLYRDAIVLGRERLDFDRLGLFRAGEDPNMVLGRWGTDPQGRVYRGYEGWFYLHRSTVGWDSSRLRWNIAVKTDVEIKSNGDVLGRGWIAFAMLWNEENPVGWLAADNLIRQEPLDDEKIELLGLYASTLGALILMKEADEEIRALNDDLEDRVRERTAELEAANKEMETFAYSVSHDLRAPLRGIDGFSQILSEDYADKLDAEGQRHLQRVRAASQRMGQLIDDLLKLSRITRNEMNRTRVDLSLIAQNIADDLLRSEPERQVEFVIAPGLVIHADDNLMHILMENLLGNAWKYTSKNPRARVEFGSQEPSGQRVYFVRDDGAGFDMTYAEKLFTPFQRLHTLAEFEGTGIGLATVQRIIQRHGGTVWAEGAVQKGATLYFTLPA